jgi:putative transposase
MPRIARYVAPTFAHHITQRGTARQVVFRTRSDRRVYLGLLREQASFLKVSILAYCLMPNHIHLIAVPPEEDSLAVFLRRVHGRFAQYFNARRARSGHLWQNRFYSCPMGPSHLWTAIRYVECNPVRAGLAAEPAEFEWSSAEAHFSGQDRQRLLDMHFFEEAGGIAHWRRLFGEPESEPTYSALRKATHSGQPFGDQAFRDVIRATRATGSSAVNTAATRDCAGETLVAAG